MTRPVAPWGGVFAGIGVATLAVVGVLALGGHGGEFPRAANPGHRRSVTRRRADNRSGHAIDQRENHTLGQREDVLRG